MSVKFLDDLKSLSHKYGLRISSFVRALKVSLS